MPITCLKDCEYHQVTCLCEAENQCQICDAKRRLGPAEFLRVFEHFAGKQEECDQVSSITLSSLGMDG